MEPKEAAALRQRGLDDEIAIYEIKLAKMREQRQIKFTVMMFFVIALPLIIFLTSANHGALLVLISSMISLFVGKIIMISHHHKYKRLLRAYNTLAQEMLLENKGVRK